MIASVHIYNTISDKQFHLANNFQMQKLGNPEKMEDKDPCLAINLQPTCRNKEVVSNGIILRNLSYILLPMVLSTLATKLTVTSFLYDQNPCFHDTSHSYSSTCAIGH